MSADRRSFLAEALEGARVGEVYPLSGRWPHDSFPDRAQLLAVPFRRARWQQSMPGVLAQYREACPYRSMHAWVVRDGASGDLYWVVDHEDLYNPDLGHPIAHFFHDYEPGKILRPAALALVGLGLTRTFVGV
jgi:hypothetical protein